MVDLIEGDWVVLTDITPHECGRVRAIVTNKNDKIIEVTVDTMAGNQYVLDTYKELHGIKLLAKVDGLAGIKLILL